MANPTLLEMPIARDGAKNSIPSTTSPTTGLLSQQYGWQDINSMPVQQGGKAPSRLDFNGVLNLLSNILFYTQKGWQFEWDSSQAYYAGCIVKDTSDGKMYQCLNGITSNTAPHSDTTNWKLWDLSMLADYLPLSGGAMTGEVIRRNRDDQSLALSGGNTEGAIILLGGKYYENGALHLYAGNGTVQSHIFQTSDGGLYFIPDNINNKNVLHDLAGTAIVSSSMGENGYIKNAKGLIMQWGRLSASSFEASDVGYEKTISLPISFTQGAPITAFANFSRYGAGGEAAHVWAYCEQSQITLASMSNSSYNVNWFAIGY